MSSRFGTQSTHDLIRNYDTTLSAGLLRGPSELEEAQKLRYRVYCLAHGFEDPRRFPDGMERDAHDPRSIHVGVRHRATETLLGTLRLIPPHPRASGQGLPVMLHCGSRLNRRARDLLSRPGATVGEISRFAIPKMVQARIPRDIPRDREKVIPLSRRTVSLAPKDFNSVSLGLIGMALKASLDRGISHWLVCMEPALARLVARHGMRFDPVGPVLEYHGRRQPMVAPIADLLSGIHSKKREFFYLIRHFQEPPEERTAPTEARPHDDYRKDLPPTADKGPPKIVNR